ncbi:MAG: small acid-soluble spore protein [Bacteroidota bacterium]
MSHKKDADRLRTQRALDRIRWESAKELGLTDETRYDPPMTPIWPDYPSTGGIKDRLRSAEEKLARESARKAELNLKEGPAPKEGK